MSTWLMNTKGQMHQKSSSFDLLLMYLKCKIILTFYCLFCVVLKDVLVVVLFMSQVE